MSNDKIVDEWLSKSLTGAFFTQELKPSESKVWTINEWLMQTRLWLEQHYQRFWLRGEISNFMQAASGHSYFVLKEGPAQIRCVYFKMYAQRSSLKLRNGLQVEVFAQATIYEERGDLQLRVEQVREVGLGDLWQRFLALKMKLEALGWFAPEGKRPLPPHPQRIGIITSPQAAALRDVVITLRRRASSVQLIVYPTPVQGEDAPERIANMIRTACARAEVDVLILCRGGGSLEDLAAFNDERVAQALFEATLPIISGVGHETDFTIADFVADARAPTPTGAAVMAAPEERELRAQLLTLAQRFLGQMRHRLEREQLRLDHLGQQLRSPRERLLTHRQHLNHLLKRWQHLMHSTLPTHQHLLALRLQRFKAIKALPSSDSLQRRFEHLQTLGHSYIQHAHLALARVEARHRAIHPMAPLERGYAVISTPPPDKNIVTSIKGLAPGQPLQVSLRDGIIDVAIISAVSTDVGERSPG